MKIVPYAAMSKRQKGQFDSIVECIVRDHCSGIAINILDIPRVFDAAISEWDRAISNPPVDMTEVGSAVKDAVVNKYRELAKGGV